MTIYDWARLSDDTTYGNVPSLDSSISLPVAALPTATNPKMLCINFDAAAPIFEGAIYPRFGTVNGKSATGWSEGLMECWFTPGTGSSVGFEVRFGVQLQNNRTDFYLLEWRGGGGGAYVNVTKNGAGASALYNSFGSPPFGWVSTGWFGLRAQFRYTDQDTKMNFKMWGHDDAGGDWVELTPVGGVIDTSPHGRDSSCEFFIAGNMEIDDAGNQYPYIDNFSMKRVPNPPL